MKFSFEEYHIWQQFANSLICDKQVRKHTRWKLVFPIPIRAGSNLKHHLITSYLYNEMNTVIGGLSVERQPE